jgi:hypothetical protein
VLAVAVTGMASPAAAAPAARGRVHVAVVSSGEMLGSERRSLARIESAIERTGKVDVGLGEATAGERAIAAAYLGAAPPAALPALPSEWAASDTVIVLEVLPPVGTKPKRTSRGLGGVLVFRPTSAEPLFIERVDSQELGVSLDDALGEWLGTTVSVAAASGAR